VRCIVALAALIGGTALLAEAQSTNRFICTKGDGPAICAPLSPPKVGIDPHPIQFQAPEIQLPELRPAPLVIPPRAQAIPEPFVPHRETTGLEPVLPGPGMLAAFGDVLDAARRHQLERQRTDEAQGEDRKSEQRFSEEARGLMDSLRVHLEEMNDFVPNEPPDITVDRSTQPTSAAQLKGQLILSWHDMRDEYCKYHAGAKYVGLDSNQKHCNDPRAGPEQRAADRASKLMEYLSSDLSRISIQEQDHASTLRCAAACPLNEATPLTTLSSSDPQTERIIQTDRTKWLEMRQVYCHYYHGAEYVDLEFKRQTCP
jgi:hypothetical protein